MPFDGAVLHSVVNELKEQLTGGRIDKIHQPAKEQLRILIRTKAGAKRLLLSANAQSARIHLTTSQAENPAQPPMFTMMLRKRIGGGIITEISQHEYERVVEIKISARDELGISADYILRHEIMGKHSNIILCQGGTIVDAIKRIDYDKSRVRQILPKVDYEYPPKQDKLDPEMMDKSAVHGILLENKNDKPADILNKNIQGLSKRSAFYLSYNMVDMDKSINSLSGDEIDALASNTAEFYSALRDNSVQSYLIKDIETLQVKDFFVAPRAPFEDKYIVEMASPSEAVDEYYTDIDLQNQLKQHTNQLQQSLRIILKRTRNKLAKQQKALEDTTNADKYKLYGELLTAYQNNVPKGAKSVELINYYSEQSEMVQIPLNPEANAIKNAQSYFKKYQKLNRAREMAKTQVVESAEELAYLEGMEQAIAQCGDLSAAREILEEFTEQGYVKRKKTKVKVRHKESKPRHYVSSDGYDMFVGRNNKQNDYITMKMAKGDDVFLHTQKIPGSHVILQAKDSIVSKQAISEAAMLAAYYSKAQSSSNVPVDYTKRRNIKKPNGAKPGYVIYSTHSSINVTPSKTEIDKIRQV